ncbi:hypothetical protein HK104_009736 [Borealophlyctis nickersoniae]|nr:hypothetical protein HK104_009736 [Borealophlyctis nickersoniae]
MSQVAQAFRRSEPDGSSSDASNMQSSLLKAFISLMKAGIGNSNGFRLRGKIILFVIDQGSQEEQDNAFIHVKYKPANGDPGTTGLAIANTKSGQDLRVAIRESFEQAQKTVGANRPVEYIDIDIIRVLLADPRDTLRSAKDIRSTKIVPGVSASVFHVPVTRLAVAISHLAQRNMHLFSMQLKDPPQQQKAPPNTAPNEDCILFPGGTASHLPIEPELEKPLPLYRHDHFAHRRTIMLRGNPGSYTIDSMPTRCVHRIAAFDPNPSFETDFVNTVISGGLQVFHRHDEDRPSLGLYNHAGVIYMHCFHRMESKPPPLQQPGKVLRQQDFRRLVLDNVIGLPLFENAKERLVPIDAGNHTTSRNVELATRYFPLDVESTLLFDHRRGQLQNLLGPFRNCLLSSAVTTVDVRAVKDDFRALYQAIVSNDPRVLRGFGDPQRQQAYASLLKEMTAFAEQYRTTSANHEQIYKEVQALTAGVNAASQPKNPAPERTDSPRPSTPQSAPGPGPPSSSALQATAWAERDRYENMTQRERDELVRPDPTQTVPKRQSYSKQLELAAEKLGMVPKKEQWQSYLVAEPEEQRDTGNEKREAKPGTLEWWYWKGVNDNPTGAAQAHSDEGQPNKPPRRDFDGRVEGLNFDGSAVFNPGLAPPNNPVPPPPNQRKRQPDKEVERVWPL